MPCVTPGVMDAGTDSTDLSGLVDSDSPLSGESSVDDFFRMGGHSRHWGLIGLAGGVKYPRLERNLRLCFASFGCCPTASPLCQGQRGTHPPAHSVVALLPSVH